MNQQFFRNGKAVYLPPRSGHVLPVAPSISLDEPGRLRVAHVMAIFSIGHSTLYARLKTGQLPQPDGNDGRPYWNTSTVRPLLEGTEGPPSSNKPVSWKQKEKNGPSIADSSD